MNEKILIIEDEINYANIVRKTLENDNFLVETVHDGALALEKFYQFSPSLVLLDINLPNKSGWDICREIRNISKIPIIIMTARDTESDEILGLELGADDYVIKPSSIKIISIKIKKILKIENNNFFSLDKLNFDFNKFKVTIDTEEIILNKREAFLLKYLFKNQNIILSRETLLNEVWGFEFLGEERAVDTLVTRLRKKIEPYGDYIKSIRGVGYVFNQN